MKGEAGKNVGGREARLDRDQKVPDGSIGILNGSLRESQRF
jgi:hypothetical protein